MHPFVRDGDVLTLLPPQGLACGDVALATRGGALRLHRVLAVDGEGRVLLRGDALRQGDGWYSNAEVVARAGSLRRGSRTLPRALWSGRLLLVLATLARLFRRARSHLRRGPVSGQLQA